MKGPLEGIRVVEFTQYIAGPGAGSVLAELGADVVKIEPIAGDATRHLGTFGQGMLHAYNRGKRSLALDLRHPDAVDVAQRLISQCDVLLQNMRPGGLEKYGLGDQAMRTAQPALIYASISGFGLSGISATRAGLDIAAQAESGMMWITGEADREPQRVGFAVADASTAHILAQAVLAALFNRERTGSGDSIEVSLLGSAVHLQAANLTEYLVTGVAPTRSGNGQPSAAPAADLIRTADGWIVLSAYTDDHWGRLCRLIGRDELIDDQELGTLAGRVTHRDRLHESLEAAMRSMTAEDCAAWLSENGLVAGAVRDYPRVVSAQNVEDLGVLQDDRDPASAGPAKYVRLPYRMASMGTDGVRHAPGLGEHSVELLLEVGYTSEQVRRLTASGAVADSLAAQQVSVQPQDEGPTRAPIL